MSEEIDDIDKLNDEKEPLIEDNYYDENNKRASVKINRPKVEQHIDKRKIIALFVMIALISIIMTIGIKISSPKKEKEEEKNLKVAREESTINVTEEGNKETTEAIKTEENNVTNEEITKTADDYDKLLGDQYNDNERIEVSTVDDTLVETIDKKNYRKSPIGFNKKNEKENQNQINVTPEQGILMQHQAAIQQQNLNGTQTIDTTQNRQESKQKFISTQRNKSFYSSNTVVPPLSKYEIKAGDMIPAILLTSINSDLPGEILAQVTSDVHDFRTLKYTLIPKGSRIIGRYDSNITYGQNRILVVWDRIVFPNGQTLLLDNYQGVDLSGSTGLKGKTNNHFWKLLRSIVLSAGINMAAGRLEDVNVNINSSNRARVTLGTGARDLSQNVETIGSRLVEKDLNQQPTIVVKAGERFNIFVNTDMVLPIYK